jgi:hypothetical protein
MLEEAGMEMRAQDIKFVVSPEGKPTAVLVDIAIWEQIVNALEDADDIILVKETLATLEAAGSLEAAGFILWEKARKQLEQLDDAEE